MTQMNIWLQLEVEAGKAGAAPRLASMLLLFLMPIFRSPVDGSKHEVGPADLYKWSVSQNLNGSNVNVLAGLHDGNLSAGEPKSHEKGWTLAESTVWLQNEQSGEYISTCYFMLQPQRS